MMNTLSKVWNFSPTLFVLIAALWVVALLATALVTYASLASRRVDRMRAAISRDALKRCDWALLSVCTTAYGPFAGPARMPVRQDSIVEHMDSIAGETAPRTVAGHARARG